MRVVESSIASGRKETAIAAIAIIASTVQVPKTNQISIFCERLQHGIVAAAESAVIFTCSSSSA